MLKEETPRKDSSWHDGFLRFLQRSEVVPDPHGWMGLVIITGVVACHLSFPSGSIRYLFSENLFIEVVGHLWLLLGPPLAFCLGVRHLIIRGDSLLPVLTVPVAFLLTVLTGFAVTLSIVS